MCVASCSAVAVYFIDKLALRAGNEKDSDETADTVGCCSLRVEHLSKYSVKFACSVCDMYTCVYVHAYVVRMCVHACVCCVCVCAYAWTLLIVQGHLPHLSHFFYRVI